MTIIVPAFNAQDTIARMIASVMDQSDERWQLHILIDGKTTDRTFDEACSYVARRSPQDPRISIEQSSSTMLPQLLYELIENSDPYDDIIGVLDADDELMPDAVGIVLSAYEKDPQCGVLWTQHLFASSYDEGESIGLPYGVTLAEAIADVLHYKWWGNRHWTTFRKTTFMSSPYGLQFDIPYATDLNLMCALAATNCKARFLHRICYIYHHNDHGVTHSCGIQQNISVIKLKNRMRDYLKAKHSLTDTIVFDKQHDNARSGVV